MKNCLVFLMFVFVFSNYSWAEEKQKKVYVAYIEGETTYTLQSIKKEKFHGISCIKGTFWSKSSWAAGKDIIIPSDKILHLIEFESIEDYESSRKKYYDKKVTG